MSGGRNVVRRHPRSGRNELTLIEGRAGTILRKEPHGSSRAEAVFYRRVAPRVAVAPRVKSADVDSGVVDIEYHANMRPASECRTDECLSAMVKVGAALAQIHAVDIEASPSAIPTALPTLDPVPVVDWIDASDGCRQVIRHVQQRPQLTRAYSRLLSAPGPHGFIHGDLKLDNILIGRGAPLLIDWELSGGGPTSHDLASLIAALLGEWIRGLQPRSDQQPEQWVGAAKVPLSRFAAATRGFLTAYLGGLAGNRLSPPSFDQLVNDIGACLVVRAWAGGLLSRELGSQDRLRLLVAESIMERPDELLLGMRW